MSKRKRGKKTLSKSKKFDRHFFSVVVGLALGTGAFYAQRAIEAKAAIA